AALAAPAAPGLGAVRPRPRGGARAGGGAAGPRRAGAAVRAGVREARVVERAGRAEPARDAGAARRAVDETADAVVLARVRLTRVGLVAVGTHPSGDAGAGGVPPRRSRRIRRGRR